MATDDDVVDRAQGRQAGADDADADFRYGPDAGVGIGPWRRMKQYSLAFLRSIGGKIVIVWLTGCVGEGQAVQDGCAVEAADADAGMGC